MIRYRLIQDDDGHWYVISKAKEIEFREWLESPEADDGVEPDFATRVDGPHSVIFSNWNEV